MYAECPELRCCCGLICAQIKEAGNAPKDGVMVCGDSGNDVELFAVPGVRGCMVVNAHDELKDWCNSHASPDIFQVGPINIPQRLSVGIEVTTLVGVLIMFGCWESLHQGSASALG